MVEPSEEKKEKDKTELIFEQLAVTQPARPEEDDDDDDGEEDGHKSLTEVEGEASADSDLKTTLKRLFPQFKEEDINTVAQAVMVARVAPESFWDRIRLTTYCIVENHDADSEDVDVKVLSDGHGSKDYENNIYQALQSVVDYVLPVSKVYYQDILYYYNQAYALVQTPEDITNNKIMVLSIMAELDNLIVREAGTKQPDEKASGIIGLLSAPKQFDQSGFEYLVYTSRLLEWLLPIQSNSPIVLSETIVTKKGSKACIDPMMVFNLVNTAFEIGLGGRGREDAVQIAGAARESEELEGLSKKLLT